ncbi:MAG: hypothetical protein ACLFVJ_17375 [Persicimonas sp.]
MTQLPSMDEMSPDAWVAAMHTVRDQVVEEIADVLDLHTRPDQVAPAIQRILDSYRPQELGDLFEPESANGERALEVRPKEDLLVVWAFPTEDYESIVYTAFGYWWFDHSGTSAHELSRHEVHRRVAERLVRLLPWANDDNLLELAAIEMSSRSG